MDTIEDQRVEIVRMNFGSHLYGTATEHSDMDFKGVFIPARREILLQRVPHSVSSSTKERNDAKNTNLDIDSESYSLHYFLHLACEGETVALDMLHAPKAHWLFYAPLWEELTQQRTMFYTKNLKSFVGYARRQAAKYGIKGTRLADAKRVLEFLQNQPLTNRIEDVWDVLPEGEHLHKTKNEVDRLFDVCGKMLNGKSYCRHHVPMLEAFVQRYGERARQAETNSGIDWKALSHAFRAAYQVKHILVDGTYSYPLPETDLIRRVKSGVMDFQYEVAPRLEELMSELEGLSEQSKLPEHVDREYWDDWLYCHLREWSWL